MGDVRGKAAFNKNNSNGSTSTGGRYARLSTGPKSAPITWSQVNGPKIKECVGFVTSCGDAVTFGRTTDGGALSVTVLSGPERIKQYGSTPTEVERILDDIIAACGPDI